MRSGSTVIEEGNPNSVGITPHQFNAQLPALLRHDEIEVARKDRRLT